MPNPFKISMFRDTVYCRTILSFVSPDQLSVVSPELQNPKLIYLGINLVKRNAPNNGIVARTNNN